MSSKQKKKKTRSRPHNFMDLTGKRFNRLRVVELSATKDSCGKPKWMCVCDCGSECEVSGSCLRRGQTQSCGCLCVERSKLSNTTHGKKGSRVHRIWSGMLNRCRNKNCRNFPAYGGRGITVCARWMDFALFYSDMGDPPTSDHTIERKENNSGYSKSNCEWVPSCRQALNRRNTLRVRFRGKQLAASEVDRILGLYAGTTARRISRGWTETQLDSPVQSQFSRKQCKR